jgi:hypothetical protein
MSTVANSFQLFLSSTVAGGASLQFPVNPDKIEMKYPGDNKTYNVLDIGEIVVPRLPKLAQYSWDSFFPIDSTASYVLTKNDFYRPAEWIGQLQRWQTTRQVLRFILHRGTVNSTNLPDTNTLCVIENFDTSEHGGEVGDAYYKIALMQYRPYAPQKVALKTNADGSITAFSTTQRANDPTQYSVGQSVVVNGPCYFSSSNTDVVALTIAGQQVKIQCIKVGADNPYLLQSSGSKDTLGWVNADELEPAPVSSF